MAPDFSPPYEAGQGYTSPARPVSQSSQPLPGTDDDFGENLKGSCLRLFVVFVLLALITVGVWYFFFKKKNNGVKKPPVTVRDENLIGSAGGEVRHPSGAKIIVPPGALDRELRIRIEKVADGRVTDLYHLLPDGLRFIKPVKVVIPYKERGLYDWETPYDITLWYGDERDALDEKKRTTVLWGEKKVSTDVTRL